MQVKSISPLEDGFLRKLEFIALKPKILYYYGKSPSETVDSEAKGEKNISEKEKEKLEKLIKGINEKYGIKKRWRAEYGKIYYYMNEFFQTTWIRDNHNCYSNKKYEIGNHFKTEAEALEYAEYMKKCSLEWHEKRGNNE